ncbi:MAG TPA: protease pro-enzyme activation domain-containing protein [Candidatus Sulfopaludibacter sp.]|nr:protease pro-enzyme activation domain-containing protein [Candidatus Sulfopaludibacter sp.]
MTMRYSRFLAPSAAANLLLWGLLCGAQATVAGRITGPINEQSRIALRGNVSAAAQSGFDRGEAPGATQLTRMRIVLARSAAKQAALDRFEQELQEKSSANYHRWLTPQEFGRLYGPADSDVAAIAAWLQSHGFAVDPVAPGRTSIAFSGTVRQVEETFHTSVHSYEVNGRQFFANNTDPEIPSALAPVIVGIAHLNTLRPLPSSVRAIPGRMDPASRRLEPMPAAAGTRPKPAFTSSNGGSLYLVPGDAATIYDTPNSTLNANYSSSASYDGTGVTIGVIGSSVINTSTFQNYRSNFLGDTTAPVVTNIGGVTFTGGSSESYIDLEIAGGLAPGATLHYYVANDLTTPLERALTDNTIDILAYTFTECENIITSADNAAINKSWEQAAAQGIAVVVATGDSGSAACDDLTSNGQDTALAVKGLAVNADASTPYNIAVGGTDFDALDQNFSGYSTTGGSATTYYRTALKYIPEATFNDSSQSNNGLTYNMPWGTGLSIYPANIGGGGGGPSRCSTNNTAASVGSCISGYAKPSWQRGPGVPADNVRDLPDISMMAGNGFYSATWLACDDSTNATTGATNNCAPQSDGSFSFAGYGGTSTSAPAFAGVLALVEQSTGGRLGQAAAQLYNLYNGSYASEIFHDVTQGNNSVSCKEGSPDCSKDSNGYYFEKGYNAGTGYDLATGLGSVDATKLISYWSTATSGATATVTVTPAQSSTTVAQSLSVAVSVAGAAGNAVAPSGTVTLTGGGYTSPAETLSNGSYSFTIPANTLAVGADTLTATYSGDANYASATGTATVTVTAVSAAPSFTLSATTPAGIAPGASATSTVTVNGSNGYTGNVTLSCALTSSPAGAANLPTCSAIGGAVSLSPTTTAGTAGVAVNTTAQTTGRLKNSHWFKAAGESVALALLIFFLPGRSRRWRNMLGACILIAAVGFAAIGCGSSNSGATANTGGGGGTRTKTTPKVVVSPASASIVLNTTASVAVSVIGSGAATPTGTVTLASGSYTSSAATLTNGAATITIPADSLAAGQDTLTASYSGDTSYNAATGSAMLTVTSPPAAGGTTAGTYTFTVTGTGSDAAHTSATTTFTVTVS